MVLKITPFLGFVVKPNLGSSGVNIPTSRAYFVNDVGSYECEVDKEGSDENTILCYTK